MHQVSLHEDVPVLSVSCPMPTDLLRPVSPPFLGLLRHFFLLKNNNKKKKESKKHVHIPEVLRGTSRRFEWISAAELCKPHPCPNPQEPVPFFCHQKAPSGEFCTFLFGRRHLVWSYINASHWYALPINIIRTNFIIIIYSQQQSQGSLLYRFINN